MADSELTSPLTGCVAFGKFLMPLVLIYKMRWNYFESLANEMKKHSNICMRLYYGETQNSFLLASGNLDSHPWVLSFEASQRMWGLLDAWYMETFCGLGQGILRHPLCASLHVVPCPE